MKGAIFVAFVLVAISWQTATAEEQTLLVGSERADCYGPFLRKCLQVKDGTDASFRYFYDFIEGFDFESGYEYVLKVNIEEVENPAVDGSSVKYTLLEQVSKTKV